MIILCLILRNCQSFSVIVPGIMFKKIVLEGFLIPYFENILFILTYDLQPFGEADSDPDWVAGALVWAAFSATPTPSGTVWVPQVTPISGLGLLLLPGSSSATHLPTSFRRGRGVWCWAAGELASREFLNILKSCVVLAPQGPLWGLHLDCGGHSQ